MAKPRHSFIKERHVHYITDFLIFVAGWVIGMKISPTIGAVLIVIACVLFVYLLAYCTTGKLSVRWNKKIPEIALPLLALVLLPLLLWDTIVGFATPTILELPNPYIHQTTTGDATMLEFGVRRHETKLDITILTADGYEHVEDWWDSPGLTDRSGDAPCGICTVRWEDEYGRQVLAKPIVVSRNVSSPVFQFSVYSPQITPSRSYYVRFNATGTVVIQSVIFAGVTAIGK